METLKEKKPATIKEMTNVFRSLNKQDRNNLFFIGFGMKLASDTANASKSN